MSLPIIPSRNHAEPLVGVEVLFHVGVRHTTVTVNELAYPGGRRMLRERRYVRVELRRTELVDQTMARVEQLCAALLQALVDEDAPAIPESPLCPPEG